MMKRFAVASHYEDERRFFTGEFAYSSTRSFAPVTAVSAAFAFAPADRAAADALAVGLTDLSRVLPPFDARTWFVVELPAQAGYPDHGKATLAAAIEGMSGLPR